MGLLNPDEIDSPDRGLASIGKTGLTPTAAKDGAPRYST